jgi:hypothetical protein
MVPVGQHLLRMFPMKVQRSIQRLSNGRQDGRG